MTTDRIKIGVYLDADHGVGGQAHYALSVLDALKYYPDQFEVIGYCSWRVWQDMCDERGILHKRVVPSSWDLWGKAIAKVIRSRVKTQIVPPWYGRLFSRRLRRDGVDVCIFPVPITMVKYLDAASVCPIHDLMYKYERYPFHADKNRDYSYYETIFFNDSYYETLYSGILENASTVLVDSPLGEQHIRETFENISAIIRVLPFCAPSYVETYQSKWTADSDKVLRQISPAVIDASREPYLFYPAMHRPDKNHISVLRAMKILQDKEIVCNMVFSGGFGPITERIRDEIDKRELIGKVHFLSYVSDIELCYLFAHAQALVMPTYAGPTNIPQLEAFALGCPVLISDIYAMPEQVQDAALLFDPDSPDDIAQAIERVWLDANLRESLIERGHRRGQELSFEKFASQLRDIVIDTMRAYNDA